MPDNDPSNSTKHAYELPNVERPASAMPTEAELEQQSPVGIQAAEHDPYAALRFRDYWLFSIGWMVAVIGQQIQSVAIGYEIYKRTGSALSLGWVGAALAGPTLLLALPAGQIADWFDRRRVLQISIASSAAFSVQLAYLSHNQGSIGWMYVQLMLSGAALTFSRPARAALLPQIVPSWAFSNAVTWNSSIFQIASMLGPALGGLVILHSFTLAYLIDAGCAIIFVAILFLMRHRREPVVAKESPNLATLAAGLRFVWSKKIILATLTLDMFAVLLGGTTFLLPIFSERLGGGPVEFGWLRAAPAIGAFVMALIIAHLPPMKRAGRMLLWSVAGFGAATIVFGFSRSFWLSLVMLFLIGAFDNVSVVIRHTLVQLLTPDSMRGRVSAVNAIFIGTSNELGGFESGVTAAWFGPVISVVGGGLGTIMVVIASAFTWPQLRRFGPLQDARPDEGDAPKPRGFPVILKQTSNEFEQSK